MLSLPKIVTRSEFDGVPNRLIGEIEVRPEEQVRMPLGKYDKSAIQGSFFIKVSPDSQADAVIVQVACIEPRKGHYELIAHIANYGSKIVSVELRQPL